MPIKTPTKVKTEDTIEKESKICDDPAGHCWAGGYQEVWKLNSNKTQVLQKMDYNKCLHCSAYVYAGDVQEKEISKD